MNFNYSVYDKFSRVSITYGFKKFVTARTPQGSVSCSNKSISLYRWFTCVSVLFLNRNKLVTAASAYLMCLKVTPKSLHLQPLHKSNQIYFLNSTHECCYDNLFLQTPLGLDYKDCLIIKNEQYSLPGVQKTFSSLRELTSYYQHNKLLLAEIPVKLARCCPPRPKGVFPKAWIWWFYQICTIYEWICNVVNRYWPLFFHFLIFIFMNVQNKKMTTGCIVTIVTIHHMVFIFLI